MSAKRAAILALAVAIAIPAEGIFQRAYRDPVGILTVCYGTTKDVKLGDYRTLAQCKALLDADMLKAIDTVQRCAKRDLSATQTAAFADAVYNIGPTIVCDTKRSTLARKLQAGDVVGACNELPRWDKASVAGVMVALPGLTKRREAERALCLGNASVVAIK